ncbi:MAG: hypothetical protein ACLGH3_03815 [Actinomycetota bacterium]
MPVPKCERCNEPKIQEGRYGDFICNCCDRSSKCKHVKPWTRWKRRMLGRQV